ncbi:MAG: TetR/AcrR family transcriptional regulator [Hyphomicrobium sp.]
MTNPNKKARSRLSVGAVRSEESEKAIVAAAEKILSERGFDGFTIEAVAKEARASKPTIYRWWGDKVRLILDAHFKTRKVIDEAPDTGSARSDLIFLLTRLWRVHWAVPNNADVSRMLMAQVLIKPDLFAPYRNEYLAKRSEPFLAILDRAKARGELPASADSVVLWEILVSYQLYRLMMRDPPTDQEIRWFVDGFLRMGETSACASIQPNAPAA